MDLRRASNNEVITINESSDELHRGGEGRIFAIPRHAGMVAKIYDDPKPRQAKIDAMLHDPPSDDATPDHVSIAWPLDRLRAANDPGKFVGYLMKRIDKSGTLFTVMHPELRWKKRPHFTFWHLLVVASNVASAFRALHSKGYVVGDVNESNALVTDRGLVTLVDTDSFQVPKGTGRGVFRCTVGKPEFWPPELEGANYGGVDLEVGHDLFGLGVLLFQLLMQDVHPFSGVAAANDDWPIRKRMTKGNFPFGARGYPIKPPPFAPSLEIFPNELRELMLRCFETGRSTPSLRPAAVEWKRALDRAAKDLRVCSRNKQHMFGNHLKTCGWCELADRIKVDYFPAPGGKQVTIDRPAALSQIALPSSSSTSTLSLLHRSSSRRGAAPPSSGSGSTPTKVGDLIGEFLLGVGRRAVDQALYNRGLPGLDDMRSHLNGGTQPTVRRVHQPEIHAGRWQFRLVAPMHSLMMGPVLVGSRFTLDPLGGFHGQGELYVRGRTQPCSLAGQWRYDPSGRVFSVEGMINGAPPVVQRNLTITGGANGRYSAEDDEGLECMLQRL